MISNERKTLYVSPSGETFARWKIHWQGEDAGSFYDKKEDAVREARRMVGRLPEGYCSQIKIKKLDGTFQTEWTYGKDPFPPRG